MRQGNGTDLLGLNDPRSASIGIIYVSPNDDRKSVLAALITQEKFKRKQVAIELPNPNKAFQQPSDFEDLKTLRRKLNTQIIFIAPSGPGPAEFARQRGFHVYSSLESFAEALRNEGQVAEEKKRGWFFGGARQKSSKVALTPTTINAESSSEEQPRIEEDKKEQSSSALDPLGASIVAGSVVSDLALHGAGDMKNEKPDTLSSVNDEHDWLDLPPASTSITPGNANEDASTQAIAAQSTNGNSIPEPGIIDLTPKRPRNTKKLPVIAPVVSTAVDQQTTPKQRITGKFPSVVAASTGGVPVSRAASGSGGNVPKRGNTSGGNRKGGRNWLIVLLLLLLTLLLVCGGFSYAQPKVVASAITNITNMGKSIGKTIQSSTQSSVTITITPANQIETNSYVITAVTGTPKPDQRQVGARLITAAPKSDQKTVMATGVKQTAALQATGTLTFFNALTFSQTIAVGTIFTLSGGLQIVNDALAIIPAASPPTEGFVTVHAHALNAGTIGNIKAFTINQACCVSGVTVQNTVAFTGGQDPQNYTFVQQSDIDSAATTLKTPLLQQGQSALNSQIQPTEHLASSPQCTPTVTANQAAGDKATSVTVSVAVACSAEVYNQKELQALTTSLLLTKATTDLGQGYALVGDVVTQTKVQSVNQGIISLLVDAKGEYVYQFDETRLSALKKAIVGLSADQAKVKLKSETGIVDAVIPGNISTLPTDSTLISFVVQTIPGLQGSGTPTVGATATSTVISTTPTVGPGTPTPIPGNGNVGNGS